MKPVSDADLHHAQEWTGELIATQQAVVAAAHDFDAVMRAVLDGVLRLLPQARAVTISMVEADMLRVRASGPNRRAVGITYPIATSFPGLAVSQREALLTRDATLDQRADPRLAIEHSVRSLMSVPLPYGGEVAGVLCVSADIPGAFEERDLLALQLLAGALIIGLGNLRAADALRAHREADRRLTATFDHAPVGIAHVAPDGRFLRVNDRFSEITQRSREDLLAHGFQSITHPDDLEEDMIHVRRLLDGEADRYAMEKRYLRADGSPVWVNLIVALLRDARGAPDFFVSVVEDRSEIRRARDEAMRDPLTGLLNRRGTVDLLGQDIESACRPGGTIGLLYLDLDGFKRINDEHGHAAGDACLIEITRAIRQTLRPGDMAGRVGGDEFVVWMNGAARGTLAATAERLRCSIAKIGGSHGWPVSASLGGICTPVTERDTPQSLIARADDAMFLAKKSGKDRANILFDDAARS